MTIALRKKINRVCALKAGAAAAFFMLSVFAAEKLPAGDAGAPAPGDTKATAPVDPQNTIYKYVLKATDKKGDTYLMVCYKSPANERFDLVLNYAQEEFPELDDLRGLGVNTIAPVKCIKYPYGALNIKDRIKRIPSAKQGRKRVVFIGDAFTFGVGVQPGCAFPDAINHLLKMYGLSARWDSINLGRAGSSINIIYEDNFASAMKLSPNVIVYVWTPDGIFAPQEDAKAGGSPIPEARPSFTEFLFDAKAAASYRNLYGKKNAAGLKQMRESLALMKREAKAAGIEFKVALFPVLEGAPGKYSLADVHEKMLGILSSEGIKAIDLAPSILSAPIASLWAYDADHMPGVEAHFASALALMSFLKMSDKKPASTKTSPAFKTLMDSCNTGFTWNMK